MRPIIIEGVDGSGKSTLAKKICSVIEEHSDFLHVKENTRLRPVYMHNGGPTTSRMHAHTRQIVSLKKTKIVALHRNVPVWDRIVAVSEWVYGSTLRYWWKTEDLSVFIRWLDAYNPYLIYCNTPLDRIQANLKATAEEQAKKEYKPSEHIASVSRNYSALVRAYDRYMIYAKEHAENTDIIEVDPFTLSDIDLRHFLYETLIECVES